MLVLTSEISQENRWWGKAVRSAQIQTETHNSLVPTPAWDYCGTPCDTLCTPTVCNKVFFPTPYNCCCGFVVLIWFFFSFTGKWCKVVGKVSLIPHADDIINLELKVWKSCGKGNQGIISLCVRDQSLISIAYYNTLPLWFHRAHCKYIFSLYCHKWPENI